MRLTIRTLAKRTYHHLSNKEGLLAQYYKDIGRHSQISITNKNKEITNRTKDTTERDKELISLYQELGTYHIRDNLLIDNHIIKRIIELEQQ